MDSFHFPFSSLLKRREEEEKKKKRELTLLDDHWQEMAFLLKEIQKRIIEAENLAKPIQTKKIRADEHLSHQHHLESLRKKLQVQKLSLKYAKKQLASKRNEVLASMQKKKMLENLKQKQFETWKNFLKKKEESFYDEQGTIRYARKKMNH